MYKQSTLESLLSRPKRLILAAILLITAIAWLQLFGTGSDALIALHHAHHAHVGLALIQPAPRTWELRSLGTVFLMWVMMALAMMLPTAAPAILSFADITRAGNRMAAAWRVVGFVAGYLLVWWGFGALATVIQWRIATAGLSFSRFDFERPVLGGAVLIGAGLYQFSALKDVCLTRCRSPMAFFLSHWREGVRGAMYLGLRHGIDCVGCCWALMALMLFAGTMSISWTAGLSVLMLAEKVAPAGRTVARVFGIALIVFGAVLVASALFLGEIA